MAGNRFRKVLCTFLQSTYRPRCTRMRTEWRGQLGGGAPRKVASQKLQTRCCAPQSPLYLVRLVRGSTITYTTSPQTKSLIDIRYIFSHFTHPKLYSRTRICATDFCSLKVSRKGCGRRQLDHRKLDDTELISALGWQFVKLPVRGYQ